MTDWVQKHIIRIQQKDVEEETPAEGQKGGPGSGHHGHAGRPGKRGGSTPGKGGGGGASSSGGEASSSGGGGKRTAASAYEEHAQATKRHVTNIRSGLRKHASEQKKEPKHWGYVGDLDSHRARLGEILDSVQQVDEGTNWNAEMMQREAKLDRGRTASEAYKSRQFYIKDMLKTLDVGLKKDRDEFRRSDQRDWGAAGYLADVEHWLKDIDDSLNGTGEYAE